MKKEKMFILFTIDSCAFRKMDDYNTLCWYNFSFVENTTVSVQSVVKLEP